MVWTLACLVQFMAGWYVRQEVQFFFHFLRWSNFAWYLASSSFELKWCFFKQEQEGATLVVSAKFSVISSRNIYLQFEEVCSPSLVNMSLTNHTKNSQLHWFIMAFSFPRLAIFSCPHFYSIDLPTVFLCIWICVFALIPRETMINHLFSLSLLQSLSVFFFFFLFLRKSNVGLL